MELAPRDIVARAIQKEIDEGRGINGAYVHLDLRHLGAQRIADRLPGIRQIAMSFAGVDPVKEPVPVQPGQHYTMGGIDCDCNGQTALDGLFAAGECACISVHGANRLGGNSLLETVVFGRRAGASAALYAKQRSGRHLGETAITSAMVRTQKELEALEQSEGREEPSCIREELRKTMTENVGILRAAGPMAEAVRAIATLQQRYRCIRPIHVARRYNLDMLRYLELGAVLDLAEIVARGALARQESRGSHYRLDFDQRDDANWLKHTVVRWSPEGPVLGYKKVVITRWQPEARRY